MIKKAVKTVFKFLFKPILNRYHLILDKLDNLEYNVKSILEIINYKAAGLDSTTNEELPPPQFLTSHQIEALSGCCYDDARLISKFSDPNAIPDDGYYTDFFGIKNSPMALQNIKHRCGTVNHDLPFPNDNFHASAVEYASLYYVIEQSKADSFTMFELGAGWGPWMSYTAKACKIMGFKCINLIGIEGEENKIPLIKEHLAINGFRQNNNELSQSYNNVNSRIVHGVVTKNDCNVQFPIVDVYAYGASLLDTTFVKNHETTSVRGYSIKTLLNDFGIIDFMHLDIQGYEFDIINFAISILNQKVRYICIGTHSRKIEGDLLDLMFENDWELLRESPCIFNKGTKLNDQHLVEMTTFDGTQFWKNKNIRILEL